ncbi:uncharacterized protein LOC117343889 isoform X3 [Pecten maximus]|uniref:uncharacterized protein LOC117343889 isoform X3 n=1 Tax=Pecten maximus TaxID=6579 RepID=UPI001458E525|nr:uncharacterized protein LOC117343889 isoform X3 [Pecten maximus]
MSGHSDKQKELEAAARDGDEIKQLEYAKYLLELAKLDTEAEENGEKAVELLVKVSQKANKEATDILRKCVQERTGVTEDNKAAVKWCLDTSDQEKRVRESARQLFRTIHGNEQDLLTFKEYITAVKAMDADARVKRMLVLAGKEAGNEVTEEKLSRILSEQIQGTLNMTSSERENQSNEFKSADVFTKVTKYPMETLKSWSTRSAGHGVVRGHVVGWEFATYKPALHDIGFLSLQLPVGKPATLRHPTSCVLRHTLCASCGDGADHRQQTESWKKCRTCKYSSKI